LPNNGADWREPSALSKDRRVWRRNAREGNGIYDVEADCIFNGRQTGARARSSTATAEAYRRKAAHYAESRVVRTENGNARVGLDSVSSSTGRRAARPIGVTDNIHERCVRRGARWRCSDAGWRIAGQRVSRTGAKEALAGLEYHIIFDREQLNDVVRGLLEK